MASTKKRPQSAVPDDPSKLGPRLAARNFAFRLSLSSSTIHRFGVYALERIPPRHKVIEYTGEKINRRETKRRDARKLHYLFTLDNYWTIDGAVGGSGA